MSHLELTAVCKWRQRLEECVYRTSSVLAADIQQMSVSTGQAVSQLPTSSHVKEESQSRCLLPAEGMNPASTLIGELWSPESWINTTSLR